MARAASTARLSLSQELRDALNQTPDYSVDFTHRVAGLSRLLEDQLKLPVKHEPDMNDSVSQMISLWVDQGGHPISPRDERARWRLNTHISSKGPYYAFVVLNLSSADWAKVGLPEPQPYWAPVDRAKMPPALRSIEKRIASVLRAECFQPISDAVLSKNMGYKTELGESATVFDVLFGESC